MAAPPPPAGPGKHDAASERHQQIAVGVQHRVQDLTRRIDHIRRAVASLLPGQQPPQAELHLESAAAFFGHPPLAAGAASSSHATAAAATAADSPVSREEVGRATWLFLHTLAAQYPEHPTRQQRRDAQALMDLLTRMYPCGECARHFKEVVAASPPRVGSKHEFSQWMCGIHNVVNRSLDKPTFNCDLVEARWAGLDCGEEDACSLDLAPKRRR